MVMYMSGSKPIDKRRELPNATTTFKNSPQQDLKPAAIKVSVLSSCTLPNPHQNDVLCNAAEEDYSTSKVWRGVGRGVESRQRRSAPFSDATQTLRC
jgi:hypothetical protein